MFAVVFFCGLFLGSFFYVIIVRFNNLKSIITGRSSCDKCHHFLAWYDLIPLLSFISLRGKCRYCHTKFSLQYPLFELLTGCSFALTYILSPFKDVSTVVFAMSITSFLLLTFFIDLKYTLIPFIFVIPATVLVYVYNFWFNPQILFTSILSAIGASLFFLFLFLITKRRGMGFGDVVYAFFMGSLLGFPGIIIGLYIAFFIGAVVGLVYLFLKKKKLHGTAIPFGPFLVIGTYIGWLLPSVVLQLWQYLLH